MFVGILQFELIIDDAESLKDKRRVVRSVKDKLHRDHMVSVAEISSLDNPTLAVMALATVSNSRRQIDTVIDKIIYKLRQRTDAQLGNVRREIITGATESAANQAPEQDPLTTDDLDDLTQRAQQELS